jgi:hypothetical protein
MSAEATNPIWHRWTVTASSKAKLAAMLVILATSMTGAYAKDKFETRCGWFDNPSPNNATLTDRDGEWFIAQQGEYEAEGDWPDFPKSQWISSGNGSYGSGCACMNVRTDVETHRIIEIKTGTSKPLSLCRRDKMIKRK